MKNMSNNLVIDIAIYIFIIKEYRLLYHNAFWAIKCFREVYRYLILI